MAGDAQLKFEKQRKLALHNIIRRYRRMIGWLLATGLFISFLGAVTPPNTYVRCNDLKISFKEQNDTISISFLLLVSLLAPFFTILLYEWLDNFESKSPNPLRKSLTKTYDYFVSLFVGDLFSFFIVEMLKTFVSEPRPHFYDSCGITFTEQQCQQPWIHVRVENCTNPNNLSHRKLIDSMKSFPSGHASIGIFSALFLSMYIQSRVRVKWSALLTPWIHMVVWLWGAICCASRITDNRHHWWDVLVGGIIGAVAAYATVKYLCNFFKDEREPQDKDEESKDVSSFKEKQSTISPS